MGRAVATFRSFRQALVASEWREQDLQFWDNLRQGMFQSPLRRAAYGLPDDPSEDEEINHSRLGQLMGEIGAVVQMAPEHRQNLAAEYPADDLYIVTLTSTSTQFLRTFLLYLQAICQGEFVGSG